MTETIKTEVAKHTPGPWRAEHNPSNIKQWMVIASTHETVVHSVAGGKDRAEANARLMAAAPDLLIVAQYVRAYCDMDPVLQTLVDAAIAKVEGR